LPKYSKQYKVIHCRVSDFLPLQSAMNFIWTLVSHSSLFLFLYNIFICIPPSISHFTYWPFILNIIWNGELGDFNAKVGREDIFKAAIGNEGLHNSNDNGVRVVNFATSKILLSKV
jgi:hypothetical protein